jgi:hypothetical protein
MAIKISIGPFIQPGESLSDAADCRAGQPVRLTMPGAWDEGDAPSVITFQVSTDNKMFNDLFDHRGEEVEVTVVPGAGVIVPPDWFRSVVYLKFRSGTRDAPVPQTDLREFAIAIDTGLVA